MRNMFKYFSADFVCYRPITSYGALDLPTYFIDITPFVPILTDGQPHAISLDVVSAEDDHTILQNWFLSAALQVFTDPSPKPTTGKMTLYSADPFSQTTTTGSVDSSDVNVTVSATRNLRIESTIVSGSGKVNHVVFSQNLQYKNVQNFLDDAQIQVSIICLCMPLWALRSNIYYRMFCKPLRGQFCRLITVSPLFKTPFPTHSASI